MSFLAQILPHLKSPDYVPVPVEKLAEQLGIEKKQFARFKTEVSRHMRQGTLVKLKKNRICLPRDADLITGIIRFRQSGSARIIVETAPDAPPMEPYEVRAEDTGVAMHGDRVVGRINEERRGRARPERKGRGASPRDSQRTARVIRILERANATTTGTLQRGRVSYFVIPDDPRIIQDIIVPDPAKTTLKPRPKVNDKVVVKLMEWKQRHLNPEGEIVEVLGKTHTPMAEYRAILHQYDLTPEFPAEVLEEVSSIPPRVSADQIADRLDLRNTFVITIDPQDAKDFDDALSIEKLDNGITRVGIHIADVSAYVQPGTALDREARKRGNSTYLVGTVIPMLPHALSNGVCSLVEAEDRLTKSVFIDYRADGSIAGTKFANSVIRSSKRLTYEQAYALLFENDLAKIRALPLPPAHQTGSTGRALASMSDAELLRVREAVRALWEVARPLREKRMREGSLELDMPEAKIFVDEEGWADRIVRIEYDESHQLIEEFMLAANEAVARALLHKNVALLHRVHDQPDADRLDELSDYLASFGIVTGDLSSREAVSATLKKIRNHPQAHMLRVEFLKSLKQACYRATPDGHYGLAKQYYTHFTSPIRRYADLVVHRIFDRHLDSRQRKTGKRAEALTPAKLAAIAEHVTLTERNSTEAERESVKLKLLEFFERELAKPKKSAFAAVIMDIRNHGMFVELIDSMAYGLIHISTLQDDLYKLSDDHTALVGRRQSRVFRIGDTIEVEVARLDRFKRQIDFKVAEPSATAAGAPKTKACGSGNAKTTSKTKTSKGAGKRNSRRR